MAGLVPAIHVDPRVKPGDDELRVLRSLMSVPLKGLPRIVSAAAGATPFTLLIRWNTGGEAFVDVSAMVNAFKAYAPLRQNPKLFNRVRVGEHGTDIVWPGDLDMSADTLWRLTQEQSQTANLKTHLLSAGFASDKADAFDAALSEVRRVGPQLAPRTVRFKNRRREPQDG